jgi:toxin-antitoxin system PIN domain toxin
MRALLDISVLIALLDTNHLHHARAMQWLGSYIQHGWASCPLTQNGCIRLMSQPAYPNARSPNDIADRLREATATEHHKFWPDAISVLDAERFDWQQLLFSRQLTDAYLLALAVRNNGVLVTLDQHIQLAAVHGANKQHLLVL